MFINLLPPNTQLKIRFRSMFRRFARMWALAGFGALICAAVQARECWHAHRRLAALEARCEPLYTLQQQIQKDRRQLDLQQARYNMLSQLQPADHFIDLLGVLVDAMRAEVGKVHVQRLAVQSGQLGTTAASKAPVRGAQPAAGATATSTLSLNGQAEDDASLAQFVAALRETGVFERVELKASSQVAGVGKVARQYQLECRFEDLP
jgi:Tfp pilus assembly protein PilN